MLHRLELIPRPPILIPHHESHRREHLTLLCLWHTGSDFRQDALNLLELPFIIFATCGKVSGRFEINSNLLFDFFFEFFANGWHNFSPEEDLRLTTPSSATPGRERGCEHGGARRRRGLCWASWRAAQPRTEPGG